MYKALFIFFVVFLLPFFANGECVLNDNNNGCQSYNGCGYTQGGMGVNARCSACDAGRYNIDADGSTEQSTECIACSDSFFDSETHKQFDNTITSYDYRNSCPWKCADKWYESNDYVAETGAGECMNCPKLRADDGHQPVISLNEEQDFIGHCKCNTNNPGGSNLIKHFDGSGYKYFCGICGAGAFSDNFGQIPLDMNGVMPDSTQGIPGVCGCYLNANRVGGTDHDGDGKLVECKCPEHSVVYNHNCVCQDQRVMVWNSQEGQYECRSCAANAEYVDGACRCRAGYYGDGQTSCAPCPNGSVTVVNGSCGCSESVTDGVCGDENCPGAAGATEISQCQCKPNYYKVGGANAFSCSLCPAGTFSDLNSSGIGSCQMNHNTQFCDANGQNCMQLIPES